MVNPMRGVEPGLGTSSGLEVLAPDQIPPESESGPFWPLRSPL